MSKYSVKLSWEQRQHLDKLVKTGTAAARAILHAQVLLKTDSGEHGPRWSVKQIQAALGVGSTMVKRIRHLFVAQGLEAAVQRKPQPARPEKRKVDGEQEAHIIAVLCTQQPEGQERWTLRALRDRVIEVEIVETVSHETLRTILKKTNSNRGRRSSGVSALAPTRTMSIIWKMCCTSMCNPMIRHGHGCVWTKDVCSS